MFLNDIGKREGRGVVYMIRPLQLRGLQTMLNKHHGKVKLSKQENANNHEIECCKYLALTIVHSVCLLRIYCISICTILFTTMGLLHIPRHAKLTVLNCPTTSCQYIYQSGQERDMTNLNLLTPTDKIFYVNRGSFKKAFVCSDHQRKQPLNKH